MYCTVFYGTIRCNLSRVWYMSHFSIKKLTSMKTLLVVIEFVYFCVVVGRGEVYLGLFVYVFV